MPPNEIGRKVIGGLGLGDDLNVGPAISPDGRWIAFLSARSVFSIDLYIADAATGKIVRKLTSTASDPHFSSLQFIYSAGAWDAASQRIAIATVTSGRPALAIFNAQSGEQGARGPALGGRRDLQPDLVAGRPRGVLHRHERAASPICSSTISRRRSCGA